MGTWDTTIFADDLAADIQASWRDGLVAKEDPHTLTDRLIAENKDLPKDDMAIIKTIIPTTLKDTSGNDCGMKNKDTAKLMVIVLKSRNRSSRGFILLLT